MSTIKNNITNTLLSLVLATMLWIALTIAPAFTANQYEKELLKHIDLTERKLELDKELLGVYKEQTSQLEITIQKIKLLKDELD